MDPIAVSATAVAPSAYCSRWTDMWNRLVPAAEVVAADCRVYFGRTPQTARQTATTGPHELQSVIDAIQQKAAGHPIMSAGLYPLSQCPPQSRTGFDQKSLMQSSC